MNYKRMVEIFDEIAEAKGNDKKPLILEALKLPDFVRVTQYILDSSKTFKVSKVKLSDTINCSQDVFEFLDFLDGKKAATNKDKEILSEVASVSKEKFTIVNKILRRKTDAGFTGKTMNKLAPGLIPYFPYMRCKTLSHINNIIFPCFSQLKADGEYHERIEDTFITRNGKPLDFSLVNTGDSVKSRIMGECLVLKSDGSGEYMDRRDGNAIINKAQYSGLSQEEADRVRFVYWDVDCGKGKDSYYTRFAVLSSLGVSTIQSRVINSTDEAWKHYDEVRALGLEGTILKNFDGIWGDGTSSNQIKLKAVLETDLKVTGIIPGKDKYEGMVGSLVCESSCGNLVTAVGMGLTDEDRVMEDWVGKIIEVRFNEVSKSKAKDTYALSHARLVEVRENKFQADTLQYILNLKEVKRVKCPD